MTGSDALVVGELYCAAPSSKDSHPVLHVVARRRRPSWARWWRPTPVGSRRKWLWTERRMAWRRRIVMVWRERRERRRRERRERRERRKRRRQRWIEDVDTRRECRGEARDAARDSSARRGRACAPLVADGRHLRRARLWKVDAGARSERAPTPPHPPPARRRACPTSMKGDATRDVVAHSKPRHTVNLLGLGAAIHSRRVWRRRSRSGDAAQAHRRDVACAARGRGARRSDRRVHWVRALV